MNKILLFTFLIITLSCKTTSNSDNLRLKQSGFSISPAAISLADVIIGKFPGIQVEGANMVNSSPRFIIRGGTNSMNNAAYAIFDIDGSVYKDYPNFLNPQKIKSITILKSMIATNRYGSDGRGGVIVIKTN